MVALVIRGRVTEKENLLVRWAEAGLRAAAAAGGPGAVGGGAGGGRRVRRVAAAVHPARSGVHPDARRAGHPACRRSVSPSTSLTDVAGDAARRRADVSTFPEVAFVFSKTGTAEVAADPMPPNLPTRSSSSSPARNGPTRSCRRRPGRADATRRWRSVPGTNYEFTQPIQMRFNELLAGVKGDVAVKVFGDDFEAMGKPVEEIARVLKSGPRRGGREGRGDRGPAGDEHRPRPAGDQPLRPERERTCRTWSPPPSAARRPGRFRRATAASTWSCACPTRSAAT